MRRAPTLLLSTTLALLLGSCSSSGTKPVDKQRQVEIHTEATVGYMSIGEFDRAIDQAVRGLALAPEDKKLRLYLARALLRRGGTQDVLRAEELLRGLDGSEDFRVPLGLAEVLERKGLAFEDAGIAIASGKRFTQNPDPAARGAELRAQARAAWEESLTLYEQANALRPNDYEVMSGLSRACSLLGRDEQSLAWAEAVLQITSTDRAFWQNQLQRPDVSANEEERLRRNIARLNEIEVALLLKASSTELRLGRRERAIDYLTRVIEIDPSLAEAYSRRAQLLIEVGRYEEAIAGIDRYLRLAALPFDHPNVQRAFELRQACEQALR